MAALTAIDATQKGAFLAAFATLSADDTFTFDPTKKQLLVLNNTTGGDLTATIDGTGGSTVPVDGIGSVDVSAGLAITVAAGACKAVVLSTIKYYCQGVAHITGAATLKAQIYNF
jgi:hypothetical protein